MCPFSSPRARLILFHPGGQVIPTTFLRAPSPLGFLELPKALKKKGIWVCSAEPRIMAMPYKLYREPQNWIKDVEGVVTVYMLCKSTEGSYEHHLIAVMKDCKKFSFQHKKSTKPLLFMLTLFLLSMGPNFVTMVLEKEVPLQKQFFESIL